MDNPVAYYYNLNPELEWNRLFVSPYRRLEYEVVLHLLDRYLSPGGKVLDVGGGPGRYAIALAKQGYRMTLVDVSEANIRFARNKIEGAGVAKQFDACETGDALDLKAFPDGAFDAVLCMGPFYHLLKRAERVQCLRECNRVMKPGAPLFVTALPRLTYLRDALRAGTFAGMDDAERKALEEIYAQGQSVRSKVPETYYCHPDEVKLYLEETGFDLLTLASCHGCAAFMDDRVNEIGKHPTAWNGLLHWVLETCESASSLSMAEHLVGVGKKRSGSGEKEC